MSEFIQLFGFFQTRTLRVQVPAPFCGNDFLEPGEVCDGTDDAACPGLCDASCGCPTEGVIVFPPAGGALTGTTSGESEYSSGACSNGATAAAPEQVFEWTAASSGPATVETCSQSTSFDTILYAREGDIDGPSFSCNDDTPGCAVDDGTGGAGRHGSQIQFDAVEGTTYYFFVDGYRRSGDFELSVSPGSP